MARANTSSGPASVCRAWFRLAATVRGSCTCSAAAASSGWSATESQAFAFYLVASNMLAGMLVRRRDARLLEYRQAHPEDGAGVFSVLHLDAPQMALDDRPHNHEPHPQPVRLGGEE